MNYQGSLLTSKLLLEETTFLSHFMSFQKTRDKAKAVVSQLPVTLHVCPTKGLRMWTTRRLHFPCTCIFTNPLCSLSGQLYTSPNTGIFLFKMIQQTLSLVYLLWIWFLYFCLRPLIILERGNWGGGSDHPPTPMHISEGHQSAHDQGGWWLRGRRKADAFKA